MPAEASHPDAAQAAFELLSTVCRAVHSVAPALRFGGSLGGGDQSGLLVRKDIADLMRLLDKAAALVLRTSRELLASLPEANGEQRTAAKRWACLLCSSAAAPSCLLLWLGASRWVGALLAQHCRAVQACRCAMQAYGKAQPQTPRPAPTAIVAQAACVLRLLPLLRNPLSPPPIHPAGAGSAASCSTCPRWRRCCTWSRPCVTARAPSGVESCQGAELGGAGERHWAW